MVTSDLLREIADMIDNGYFKNLSEDDLDGAKRVLMSLLNVNVTREQAKEITNKSDSAFSSKICRSGIKYQKEPLYKYSDMIKIRDKKI